MTDMFTSRPRAARPTGRGADWGGKALLVCALAVLMAIPGLFVFGLVADREHRASTVTAEISAVQGGAQQLLGPVLVAPYQIPGDAKTATVNGWYVVSPQQGQVVVRAHGSSRRRNIFYVPVYEAAADIDARFGPLPKILNLPAGAKIDWSRAEVVVGLSDLRGAKSDTVGSFTGAAGTNSLAFAPSSDVNLGAPSTSGGPAANSGFGLITAPAAAIVASPTGGDFKVSLRFTGAQRLSVMPFAKSTTVKVAGDWRSPSFDGAFLPDKPQIKGDSFTASWSVPFIARGLADHAADDSLSLAALGGKDLGVTFVPANNPYQSVMRALKYAVMFVGLVFLTFFVFEALSGRRLHPAQYVMIGLAQMVFYLLLLSLSEYIGFDLAFAAAAVATVGLIGLYAGAAFRSGLYRAQALAIFAAIYGLIYLLMRLEDFALLAGSLASFVGLATAMYLTRDIDWYGGRAEAPATTPPAA